ncbi:MAG: glycosyltransferase family 2 protein [Chloroflexi bacterium]|nr:glycosyltransferase family 2 protein [Chloroflexota bacterium]
MLDLAIVIVSYNVSSFLEGCLRSLYASQGITFQVCVVDNDSADDSVDMVKKEFPQAVVVASAINGGYAFGNNLGLKRLGYTSQPPPPARYALLLNPDTLLGPHSLKDMVDFMDAHPEAGVAGPKLVRPDGSLDLACRRSFPTPMVALCQMLGLAKLFPKSSHLARYNLTYLDPDAMAEVDSVVGAFMMVRSQTIEEVGLLGEEFFLYGEDLDWAFRIKEKGWKVYYNPAVTVVHYKGESSRQYSQRANREFYRAMRLFYRKHYAKGTFFLLGWLITCAIYLGGLLAYLRNLLRPQRRKGVGSARSIKRPKGALEL